MKKAYYILSLFLFCTSMLFAQDIRFTASASKTTVGTGEQFEVTFTINANGDRFSQPDMSGFQVLSGPNMSNSMTSINGNTTVSTGYSYDLMAAKQGTFLIGPASIVVNGHRYTTNPIRITVVKGQPVPQGRQMQQQAVPDDAVAQGSASNLSKSIFLRADVSKTNVYLGEQLNVNYRLYYRVGILDNRLDKAPDLNGFWSQDVNTKQQTAQVHTEIYKGERYNVADLKQTILFPERAGNLTLDPLAMTFVVRVQAPSRDIMDQFFGGNYTDEKIQIKSPPVTIHVKPLPEAGKPAGFGGAVGSFNMNAWVDKTSLKANEPLNYNVKITGAGNIKLFQNLAANFPADFEKYDPKVTDTLSNSVTHIAGSRMYNYLLIPRHEGNFTIPPIKFSYFNPATGRYVTLTSKAFDIQVAKGLAENNVTSLASANKQDVKVLGNDIRYIKANDNSLQKKGEGFYGSVAYILLLLLGPLAFAGALIYRKWDEKNNSDIVKVKSRKASKIAAKHLANAQRQLIANNKKLFYEDLFKGIYGYLSYKLNIPYANLDKETIAGALKAKGIKDELATQLLDTLDLCDMARFAPVSGIAEHEVFEKAKNTINNIEDEL